MNEWAPVRLGDVLTVKHGYAFPGDHFSDDLSLPTLVTPGNFHVGGGFQQAKPKTFNGEYPAEFKLAPGDVIVTMTDLSRNADTLGYGAVVPDDGTVYLHNQRIGKVLVTDDRRVDPLFISYLLRTRPYRDFVVGSASGSTVKHTSPSRIEAFRTELPPVVEQRRIAAVLGSLDDLIEADRKVAYEIDEIQKQVFKAAWDGKTHRRLREIASVVMGQSPTGDTYNETEQGMPFYQGTRDFGWRYPTRRVWTTAPTRIAEAGDVLVAVRAPVGELNVATETTTLGRGVGAVRAAGRQATLLQALKADPHQWDMHQGTGTVFASINRSGMEGLSVPWVDDDQVESTLAQLDSAILALTAEIADLTRTRDELLPLLMSGRVRVPETVRSGCDDISHEQISVAGAADPSSPGRQ